MLKKITNKRKILVERNDIALARTKFLWSIKLYRRKENISLVYIDKTEVNSNLTFDKCSQSSEIFGIIETGNASRHLLFMYWSNNGFPT